MRLKYFFPIALLLASILCSAQPVIMYPGDTNDDGRADHYDLLPIGLAYGQAGPLRISPTTNWLAQNSEPWQPQVLPVSQIDLAFVDCNGDGKIDSLDIDAIAINYDSIQNDAIPPPFPYIERLTEFCFSCPEPEITVTFDKDTVGSPDIFSATFGLLYPPGVPPAQGSMGIAFDIEYTYNPDLIIDSLTTADTTGFNLPDRMYLIAMHTAVTSNGLLPSPGKIGFASSGKGSNIYFGIDPLLKVDFVIEDMIIRDGDLSDLFTLNISNVLIINSQEQIIGLGGIKMDTVIVATKNLSSRQPLVQISPNPVRDLLILDSPETPMEEVEIQSTSGTNILSVQADRQNHVELPVTTLPPGIWIVVVRTQKGVAVKKFLKT